MWNHGHIVEVFLKSIKRQEFNNEIELIIVEDCSTDDSYNSLVELNKIFDFKLIKNKTNIGQANSINKAFEIAKHNVCMVANADDYWMPYCVQIYYDEILNGSNCVGGRSLAWPSEDLENHAINNRKSIMEIDYGYKVKRRTPEDVLNFARSIKNISDVNNLLVSGPTLTFVKELAISIGGFYELEKRCMIHDDRDFQIRFGINYGITEVGICGLLWGMGYSTGGTTRH